MFLFMICFVYMFLANICAFLKFGLQIFMLTSESSSWQTTELIKKYHTILVRRSQDFSPVIFRSGL